MFEISTTDLFSNMWNKHT